MDPTYDLNEDGSYPYDDYEDFYDDYDYDYDIQGH